jgi:hypothetical protein
VNESSESYNENSIGKKYVDNSDDMCQKRKRLESTSLSRTPIDDMALQDFHQHRLKNDETTFDLKYNLYSVVVGFSIMFPIRIRENSSILFYSVVLPLFLCCSAIQVSSAEVITFRTRAIQTENGIVTTIVVVE